MSRKPNENKIHTPASISFHRLFDGFNLPVAPIQVATEETGPLDEQAKHINPEPSSHEPPRLVNSKVEKPSKGQVKPR
jgi:hypothetical protein